MVFDEKGSFTLPGEAGFEKLTLDLAKKWGADVIRDSDGTKLSDQITQSGYGIYSTICIIRDHNEWAKEHMDQLQQTFLMSKMEIAKEHYLVIHLLKGYFTEQFILNDEEDALRYWQVFDRTINKEVPRYLWTYEKEAGNIVVQSTKPFHEYSVNFLAYRQWEEISMYNHVTNDWKKEHLMPIDPRSEQAQKYLYGWLKKWCMEHTSTTVVRFTSLFYNFTWIWGEDSRCRSLYSDWASYDFTVSPEALRKFEKEYKYALTAEDFINQGKFHVTHMPPTKQQLDYLHFTNQFVVELGRKLVDLVHQFGKKAYVFYDDSWIGVEPYSSRFPKLGFDGIIKCVFSGYEVRLCANVPVKIHEIRLHPYLFPIGLGGTPTFSEGGDPTADARNYWRNIRRALLRQPIERIGLGGYLHLVEPYQEFCDYMEEIANEFRRIKKLHEISEVYQFPCKVGVLHSWGKLRAWSLSGHFHETDQFDLIHINEALSGLPVSVDFLNFEDVKNGRVTEFDVIVNAGPAGSAWSGGDAWKDEAVVIKLSEWVHQGGTFLGVNEPSAVGGYATFFRMAHVLGIDEDRGERVCHGKWSYECSPSEDMIPKGASVSGRENRYLVCEDTKVYAEENSIPTITAHEYGKGRGVYLASFQYGNENTRMLLQILLQAVHQDQEPMYITDNPNTECAYYPKVKTLVAINNTEEIQETKVRTPYGEEIFQLAANESQIRTVKE
ncbi:1,3-beta-galactosyl-N-acetylhexosamine phosphorylase [Anaerosporobacter faecicola]|uniref:1,3-beta-galactosyl-N-acetylhexosamine phosphorylase n=1 Tax=Anaerosporobacter faecicola TaxID=2718714 RepID=UPI00143B5DA7|nr:1,3-beta-galactosyl-N-acetylhexosamine phosphorylase [Anaerosporobacter faecicola]